MHEREKWQIARLVLDAVGDRYGYVLAGSMALRAHGVTTRPIGDIDLFTLPDNDIASARLTALRALEQAGYSVEIRVKGNGSADLTVSDPTRPTLEPVAVQLIALMMDYQPTAIDGLPVMVVEDCIRLKAEAMFSRTDAKDFIDLHHLDMALGAEFVDQHLGVAAGTNDEVALRSVLGQVVDIPDESFAKHGIAPYEAADLRQSMVAWANTLDSELGDGLRMPSSGPAAGSRALQASEAAAAWSRIDDNRPQSLLSDHDLALKYLEAGLAARDAMSVVDAADAEAITFEQADDGFQETITATVRRQAMIKVGLAVALQEELARRVELPAEERAAEAAIRRATNGLDGAGLDATREAVTAQVTAPTAHERYAPPFQHEPYAPIDPTPPSTGLSSGVSQYP